jgi:DNA-binding Lrp family transcriptional regulator
MLFTKTARERQAGGQRRKKIARESASFYYPAIVGRGPRMRRTNLDRIDRRILRNLLDDGRITNVELARRVGISAPPCLRRVRALEQAGVIRGYHADLAPEALGYAVTVFAHVGLSSQAEADLKAFEQLVATWPEVREVYMLAGETDFLLKVVARDWDSYQQFLSEKLTSAPKVNHVKSALMLRLSKHAPGIPVTEQSSPLEDRASSAQP